MKSTDSTPKNAQKYTKFFTQNKIRNSDSWIFYGKEGYRETNILASKTILFTTI
jgi:hypothetical protein